MGRKRKLFKIILLGDADTGKTKAINCYTGSMYRTMSTIGANYVSKQIELEKKSVHLQIWDTPGEESYTRLVSNFYQNADAYLLFYDVTRPETLNHIPLWLNKLKKNGHPDKNNVFVLVGNKADLVAERKIDENAVKEVLKKIQKEFKLDELPLHKEISAKKLTDLKALFVDATKALLKKPEQDFRFDAKAPLAEPNKKKKPNTKKNRSIQAGVTTGILLTVALIVLASVFWPVIIALSILHMILLAAAAVLIVVGGGLGASVISDRCHDCTAQKGSTQGMFERFGIASEGQHRKLSIEKDSALPSSDCSASATPAVEDRASVLGDQARTLRNS